jgi:hypothetical protein
MLPWLPAGHEPPVAGEEDTLAGAGIACDTSCEAGGATGSLPGTIGAYDRAALSGRHLVVVELSAIARRQWPARSR